MAVGAVAGTKMYIGTSEALASPDDYIEVGNINNLGQVGTQFAKIAVESLGDGYTRQLKGTQSSPTLDVNMNRDDSDLGQIAMKAAAADRNSLYNFKIVENDIGSGTQATTSTFKGRVFGSGTTYGGVNDLKKYATSVEIEPDTIATTAAS